MANGAKQLLEEYTPRDDESGAEFRRVARVVLLELLDHRRCDFHSRQIAILKRFMWLMLGAWTLIATVISGGHFVK